MISKQRNNARGMMHGRTAMLVFVFFTVLICNAHAAQKTDLGSVDSLDKAKTSAGQVLNNAKIDAFMYDDKFNMYRIEIQGNILFMTPDMKYVFVGDVIDTATKKSIINTPVKVDFSSLPLQDAIKVGSGPHKIALFMSMKCPHCHKLYKEMVQNKALSIYVFLYPANAQGIWCASDKENALYDAVVNGKDPKPIAQKCDLSALQRNVEFARSKKIRSTPTLIYGDGDSTVGYIPQSKLNEIIATKGK